MWALAGLCEEVIGSGAISHSQRKPRSQLGGSAKGHGVELDRDSLPKYGCAVGQTIDAQALVNVRASVGSGVPKPYRASLFGFANLDEAVLASNRLKVLRFLHRDLSLHGFRRCLPTTIREVSLQGELGLASSDLMGSGR